jgi:hypothetical protein
MNKLRKVNGELDEPLGEEMEGGLKLKHKHRTGTFDYRPFGGESVDGVIDRLMPFIGEINQKHQDHETLLVTHGGIIRLMNLLEQGKPTYETEDHVRLLINRSAENHTELLEIRLGTPLGHVVRFTAHAAAAFRRTGQSAKQAVEVLSLHGMRSLAGAKPGSRSLSEQR